MASGGSKTSIYAAIAANLLIAIMKFTASVFTGSAAMLSEGIHSIIDTSNGLLLLLGISKAKEGPDKLHPFGHGKEVYFWSFIVAILIFALGGGMAIYEGIMHLMHPPEVLDHSFIMWSVGVLIFSMLFEGYSLSIAWKNFRAVYPKGFRSALIESKDAATLAIIIEESTALIGLSIAFVGVLLTYFTDNALYDALASISIGLLLTYTSYFMARETRNLLVGEAASDADLKVITDILEDYKEIDYYGNIKTMHLGPDEVILGIEANFKDDLRIGALEPIIANIKTRIQESKPIFKYIYIETNAIQKG